MLNKDKDRPGVLISILGFREGGAEIMPIRIANYLHARHYNVGVHCLEPEQNEKIRKQLSPGIPVHCTHRFWKMGIIIRKYNYSEHTLHRVTVIDDPCEKAYPFSKGISCGNFSWGIRGVRAEGSNRIAPPGRPICGSLDLCGR